MKKTKSQTEPEMRPEYDFSQLQSGVKGKYAERYREVSNFVLLDPDVAAEFPNAKAVNDVLREILNKRRSS
jgi:hypothetical protein